MFITPEDFTRKMSQEKIDAVADGDTTLLPTAINTAIGEAKFYLSRFDLADLFGKAGDQRDPILMQWLLDMTAWYFIAKRNPVQ